MRVISLAAAAFFNLALMGLAASTLIAQGVAWPARVLSLVLVIGLGAIVAFLVLAGAGRVLKHGFATMRALTIAVPALWLLAALDTGRISGQETAFLLLSCLVAWGTWQAFRRSHPGAS